MTSCRLKLAIIDLDQTIIDTLPRFYRVFCEGLRKIGLLPPSYDEFLKRYREDRLDIFIPKDIRPQFWIDFLKSYHGPLDEVSLIPGVPETLRQLRKLGLKVVVVTGRLVPREFVEGELKALGLLDLIDEVYTGLHGLGTEDDMFSKAPLVWAIIQKWKVSPNEVVVIGDYKSDVALSRRTGVLTVGVCGEHMSRNMLVSHGATAVVGSFSEVTSIIVKLCGMHDEKYLPSSFDR